MSFQGNLASVSFPDILQLLTLSKKSGTLILNRGDIEKKVYLKNGSIIFAESSVQEDRFDNHLLGAGIVNLDDLQKARKVQEVTGKDLASTLVYLSIADKDKIATLSRSYVENIVFSLFSWEEGEFIFEEGQLPDTDIIVSTLNTMNILMEGTRRIDEWTRIRNALPAENAIPQVSGDALAQMKEVKLSPSETMVLALVDGERCIAEMREKSSMDQLSFAKSLYNLISAGLVKQIGVKEYTRKHGDEQRSAIELASAMYNLSIDLVLDVIKEKMGKSGTKIIIGTYTEFRSKYKVLEYITVSENGNFDFSNFTEMCNQLPAETRMHEISSGLSMFLTKLLNSITGTIGNKQRKALSKRIDESVEPLVRENEEVLKKYGILSDFKRSLE